MDIALLALRIVFGIVFVAHGAQKLLGAFGGPGIARTAGSFEQLGLRPGRLHAWVAGLFEVGGGVLLALGLVTPFAAAAIIAVMTAATLSLHLPNGFFVTSNGFEYPLVVVATAFALAGVGPGEWALDNALDLDLNGTGWGLAALGAGVLGGIGAVLSGRLVPRRHAGQPSAGTA
jgi:putative oxidoreductase